VGNPDKLAGKIYRLLFKLCISSNRHTMDEGYSPLNNRVIQWTCVLLEVIHRWRRLEAKIFKVLLERY
jgi:hypothetical protein